MERNPPILDTIRIHDTITKTFTITVPNASSKGKDRPLFQQNNKSGDNQANINTGTVNGILGNNSTLIQEEKVLHPADSTLSRIEGYALTKDDTIDIKVDASQADKNFKYASELGDELRKRGYKHIYQNDINSLYGLPNKRLTVFRSGTEVYVYVDMH